MIRTLKDRVRSRFDVRMSEVGGQSSKDSWQHIVLGFAVVSGTRRHAEDGVEKIAAFVDGAGLARVIGDRREVISFTDDDSMSQRAAAVGSLEDWSPPEWAAEAAEAAEEESLEETVDLDDEGLP